jgi:hypothetical protein
MIIVPILQIVFFYLAIGGNPIGLKFGVVDDEVNYNDCFNSSLITTIAHDDTCDLHKISCRFIHEFDDSVAIKQHYSTFDEAFHDAKRGKIIGFMHFEKNFTESLDTVQREGREADDGSADNSRIQIYMDQSDLQLTFFLQSKFYQIFKNFTQHMMADCNLPTKLGNVPVNFEEPIYGSYETDFKHSMAPPMVSCLLLVCVKRENCYDLDFRCALPPSGRLFKSVSKVTTDDRFSLFVRLIFGLSINLSCFVCVF